MKAVMSRKALGELQIGDTAIRMLGGVIPLPVIITSVTHDLITVKEDRRKMEKPDIRKLALQFGIKEDEANKINEIDPTWDFDPFTGLEVDDDIPTIVSYLTPSTE